MPSNVAPKRAIALHERSLRASAFSSRRFSPSASNPCASNSRLQDGFTAPDHTRLAYQVQPISTRLCTGT